MADHLKRSATTGHLLRQVTGGHLVYQCAAGGGGCKTGCDTNLTVHLVSDPPGWDGEGDYSVTMTGATTWEGTWARGALSITCSFVDPNYYWKITINDDIGPLGGPSELTDGTKCPNEITYTDHLFIEGYEVTFSVTSP